ncbi:MAG: DUF1385 domain-containing protein [Clostridia bacterium]|nr:DUF1385 domain-containing protein [Clostridia bacterium]
MMKNPQKKTALAVRKPDKTIDISYINEKSLKDKYAFFRLPVIRGVITYIETMIQGYKVMMKSADISGFTDIEQEKESTKKDSALIGIITTLGTVLGILLAVVLFWFLPTTAVDGIEWLINLRFENFEFSSLMTALITQTIKICILVAYMFAISFMKDIYRVFAYHGAEHKTIFCYEAGLPLTVENVKKQKRLHPRCGTSFLILMILVNVIISTVLYSAIPVIRDNNFYRFGAGLILLPLICGVGYEVLKICGRYDNVLTRIISAPGMWLQKITTKEPDDDMIEIAIAALKACDEIEDETLEEETENNDNI